MSSTDVYEIQVVYDQGVTLNFRFPRAETSAVKAVFHQLVVQRTATLVSLPTETIYLSAEGLRAVRVTPALE